MFWCIMSSITIRHIKLSQYKKLIKMSIVQEMKEFADKPELGEYLMVEETIQKYSGEFNKRQLWEKLPKLMKYEKFLVIIDHLKYSNKIAFDRNGVIGWIYNPEFYKKYAHRKDLMWRKDDGFSD